MTISKTIKRRKLAFLTVLLSLSPIFPSCAGIQEQSNHKYRRAVVVVGFDDLREAVYKTYLQMKDYNLVATSFATTDNMGTKSGSTSGLKLDQIKEMYDYGWDFQLHSKWHIDYNLKLYLLNDAQKGDTAITVDIKDNSAPFYNSKLTNSAPWDSDRMIYSLYLGSDLFINEEEVTIKCIDPNKNIVYLKAPISRELARVHTRTFQISME